MPHRNLIRGGSHGALAFYSGAQRGSPKVAGTRRAAPRPFRRALSYQALEAVLRRGTVPAEAARSDQSERPLGRDRAHAAATHRNLRSGERTVESRTPPRGGPQPIETVVGRWELGAFAATTEAARVRVPSADP